MVSLRRKKLMREEARRVQDAALKAARVGRAGQVARSTVETSSGDVAVADALTGGAEAIGATEGLLEDVDALDHGLGLDELDQYQDAEDAAHDEQYRAIEVEAELGEDIADAVHAVDEAQAAADDALDQLANLDLTAAGFKRVRSVTEPEEPESGWERGDEWVLIYPDDHVDPDLRGQSYEVRVWNGTAFVHADYLMSAAFVVGPNGVIQMENGRIVAPEIVAPEMTGGVVTGATVRTAEAGQRVQMDLTGIGGFSASGTEVFRLAADSGGLNIGLAGSGYRFLAGRDSTGAHSSVRGGPNDEATLFIDETLGSAMSLGFNQTGSGLTLWASPNQSRVDSIHSLRIGAPAIDLHGRTTIPGNAFASFALLDAWSDAPDGTRAWVEDEQREYVRVGGEWKPWYDGAQDTDGALPLPGSISGATIGPEGVTYQIKAGWVKIGVDVQGSFSSGGTAFWSGIPAWLSPAEPSIVFGASFLSGDVTGSSYVRPNGTMGFSHGASSNRSRARFTTTYPLRQS